MNISQRELTPEEFHNEIMWALTEYPGFKFWEFKSHHRPKRYSTLSEIRAFWGNEEILWVKGYYKFLSPKAIEIFRLDEEVDGNDQNQR